MYNVLMRKLMTPPTIFMVVAAALVVLSIAGGRRISAQGSSPVFVTNPSTSPVPVTGHVTFSGQHGHPLPVSIANTPVTVTAQQTGPWSVGVGNAATSPLFVRDIGNTTGHPFRLTASKSFGSTDAQQGVATTNTSGKRMVIEHVVFMVQIRAPEAVTKAALNIDSGSPTVVFAVLPSPEPSGGPTFAGYGGSSPVKAYLEPGGIVSLAIVKNGSGGPNDGSLLFTAYGFLVDP
jgi:hypothetical protein